MLRVFVSLRVSPAPRKPGEDRVWAWGLAVIVVFGPLSGVLNRHRDFVLAAQRASG